MILLLALVACQPCHNPIVEAYEKSPMARSSGKLTSLPPGQFVHAPSRTRYAMQGSTVTIQTPLERATQKLDYFIGSGAHGQSFLFLRGNKLFEAPVTFYREKGWGMSPGYERDTHSDWTRPIDRNCLWCHASGARPIYGRNNEYAAPAFTHDGITCDRCHAKTEGHFNNPSKLPAAARNDVCRQCHLLGLTRSDKPGHSFFEFRPGMLLDSLVTYTLATQKMAGDIQVTGHFERLGESACQKASGEKLWCGTCHNPHPLRVQDKNQACRNCHAARQCDRGANCSSCHMPKTPSAEAGHTPFTDHWIRRPGQ